MSKISLPVWVDALVLCPPYGPAVLPQLVIQLHGASLADDQQAADGGGGAAAQSEDAGRAFLHLLQQNRIHPAEDTEWSTVSCSHQQPWVIFTCRPTFLCRTGWGPLLHLCFCCWDEQEARRLLGSVPRSDRTKQVHSHRSPPWCWRWNLRDIKTQTDGAKFRDKQKIIW